MSLDSSSFYALEHVNYSLRLQLVDLRVEAQESTASATPITGGSG